MLKHTLGFLLAAGCCGVVVTTQAQQYIYKWTDPQGQPQYSELAPPPGVKYEMVRKPTDATGTGVAPRDLARDQEELAQQVAEQKEKEQQQAEKVLNLLRGFFGHVR